MRHAAHIALLGAAATLLAGCGASIPFMQRGAPQQSFFTTNLCSVVLESKDRSTRFQITLNVVRPLPRGALVETEFQNPWEKAVLTAARTTTGQERTIALTSPPVAEIRAGGFETVTRVYAAKDRKQVLGVHTQRCESLVDHRELGPEFR